MGRRYEIGGKIVLKTGDATQVTDAHAPLFLYGGRAHERRGANLSIFADCVVARRAAPESAKIDRFAPKQC